MGRIFILVIIYFNVVQVHAQNLLLNGDFEEVIRPDSNVLAKDNGTRDFYNIKFYCKDWLKPTYCSPDIFRDIKVCDNDHVKSVEPLNDFCIDVQSGNYCAGLILMEITGETEYLTGKLRHPLVKDSIYKITFWLRFSPGINQMASKGFGYKFSEDSIVFQSSIISLYGLLESNYVALFENNKIKADYNIDHIFTNTKWTKIVSLYKANGGEKFITFGMFSLDKDKEWIKQLNSIRSNYNQTKIEQLIEKNKSVMLKRVEVPSREIFDLVDNNYYFIDNISVEPLSSSELEFAQRTCFNCIDNDPMTFNIPNRLEFFVDKGFFGDLELSVYAVLKPIETLKIQLGKKEEILLNNESDHVQSFEYRFKYPASKVRNKSIVYSIIHTPGTTELQKSYKCIFPMYGNKEIRIYTNIKNIKQ